MKKKTIIALFAIILLAAGIAAWKLFTPLRNSGQKDQYVFVRTGSGFDDVEEQLKQPNIGAAPFWFRLTSRILGYKNVRPGRYRIGTATSLFDLVRMLKNGQQAPVSLVITKIRTRALLSEKAGSQVECGPEGFQVYMANTDSMRAHGFDSNTIMAAVLPLTYELNWNTPPEKIFGRFYNAYRSFWNQERTEKARQLGYTPVQIATLASIIDEETNAPADRPNIASVYMNRIAQGIPLQADPTVKFAIGNFELKRIYEAQLKVNSPFNTYMNKGLPPGPICTPSLETIDAVLNSPKTEYLYFVANSDFSGTHVFTTNYKDHLKYAKLYQDELNKRNIK